MIIFSILGSSCCFLFRCSSASSCLRLASMASDFRKILAVWPKRRPKTKKQTQTRCKKQWSVNKVVCPKGKKRVKQSRTNNYLNHHRYLLCSQKPRKKTPRRKKNGWTNKKLQNKTNNQASKTNKPIFKWIPPLPHLLSHCLLQLLGLLRLRRLPASDGLDASAGHETFLLVA